ncbi:MAG TPA: FAD-binding oxidoreductase [Stellaceae bacterium]|nr:FAD-binding oxidoreductase [Stellaceae bacterium]
MTAADISKEPVTLTSPLAVTWYGRTAHAMPERPEMQGEVETDIAILGAGFTGLSAALELASRGYRVRVLEARRVGFGASGRNGGQIVTGQNASMAKLDKLVGREDADRLWHLAEEAKRLVAERVERHEIDCDLKWGYLFAALKPRHVTELDSMVEEWAGRFGYQGLKRLDAEETRHLCASPRYIAGLRDDGAGHLHPLNYALGLARAAEAAGAVIHEHSAVTSVDTGAQPGFTTANGRVRAKYLIIAGNALLGQLVPAMARKIAPVGTYMVSTAPLGARLDALMPEDIAVCDLNNALSYTRRANDGRLLFGSRVSYTGRPPANLRQQMRRSLDRVFPQLADVAIEDCWGGMIDITVNRLPHLGRLSPTAYFAQGFSGHGVSITGIAGKVIAEAVAGTAERFDVFAHIPHEIFPGGPLRIPTLVLARTWFRILDML